MIERREEIAGNSTRALALDCLEAGVRAGDPERVIERSVTLEGNELVVGRSRYPLTDVDRVLLVGGGKAAGRQARAMESLLATRIDDGIVVTNEPVETDRVRVRQGDHPVPSERNVAATDELLQLVDEADEDTLVLVVISGGGSALLAAPAAGISLEDLQTVTRDLLESGATIGEFNTVRKHLSAVKGGQLARRCAPARVLGLAMSDVVGDDLGVIASGPTVPDRTTYGEAADVLERYEIQAPESIESRLERGIAGEVPETPDPSDPLFDRVETRIIANAHTALQAAATCARDAGVEAVILSARIRGESSVVGGVHAGIGAEVLDSGNPIEPPAVILSGGETTVTVGGDGQGGPNQECALGAALDIDEPFVFAAMDTDGIDGTGPAAGAIVDHETVSDENAARRALERNDVYPYLAERGDAIETGPTGTNLNDLRVLVIGGLD